MTNAKDRDAGTAVGQGWQ